ncbi:type II toxin-antitoxin system RelE family toxin [Candidatus Poriferisodalis sp.]|uniref:type II toxin-antitoxin system RelE family toxin n=1 Tax=Candidatus Poriferisodalis sp. TaxID=3101277 RepID=UPI003B52697F
MTPPAVAGLPSVRLSPDYSDSLRRLTRDEQHQVNAAVMLYLENPALPGLKLKKLRGKSPADQLWSMRASKELRILLTRHGSVAHLVYVDHHDAAYSRAETIGAPPPAPVTPESAGCVVSADGDGKPVPTSRHDKPRAADVSEKSETPFEATQRPLLWMWPVEDLHEYLGS